jgi:putative spermidine/putrescine transport system substrate-binding protein
MIRFKSGFKLLLSVVLAFSLTLMLAACGSSEPTPSNGAGTDTAAAKTVETDLADMSWDEILAEADGDTLTFCAWGSGGADAMVQKYWEYIGERLETEYNIQVEWVEYGNEQQERFINDYTSGIDATIDLIYGSSITKLVEADVCWGNDGNDWVMKMPNSKYIDWTRPDAQYNGTTPTDGYQAPFMKTTPAMVYAADKYTADVPWDQTGTFEGATVPGLPKSLTELYQWVQKYPGKFTYLDLLGQGGFHGTAFVESALFELTDDGSGGWKAVYNESDNNAARSEKIQAHAEEWNKWAQTDAATEEAFIQRSGYVWAYLNDLEPFLFKGDGDTVYYGADAYDMIARVNAGDIALSFTTCMSIYPKTQADPSYLPNAQLYLMQTSVGGAGFIQMAKNSQHKAAAMVACNLLLEPTANAQITAINGNAYCDSLNTMNASEKKIFEDMLASFPKGTASTAEELDLNAHNVSIGVLSSWLSTAWDSQVVKN